MLNVVTAAIDPMLIPFAGMGIGVLGMGMGAFAIWTQHKRKQQTIEVLRAYAERGEEPPESVLVSMANAAGAGDRSGEPMTRSRSFFLAGFFVLFGIGFLIAALYFLTYMNFWVFTVGSVVSAFIMLGLGVGSLARGFSMPRDDGGR